MSGWNGGTKATLIQRGMWAGGGCSRRHVQHIAFLIDTGICEASIWGVAQAALDTTCFRQSSHFLTMNGRPTLV
jgi:hypothetical protein